MNRPGELDSLLLERPLPLHRCLPSAPLEPDHKANDCDHDEHGDNPGEQHLVVEPVQVQLRALGALKTM